MRDCDRDGHMFGSGGYCHVCAVPAPPIPEFLRRQNTAARDELTAANARIAEMNATVERMREAGNAACESLRNTWLWPDGWDPESIGIIHDKLRAALGEP